MDEFRQRIRDLVGRAAENTDWRQRRCINLIPSETTPSLLVKVMEIADPSGRYAEHRTLKGNEIYFYQGTDFIRDVEEETRGELQKYFGCQEVELRPVSGQMANEVVFKGLTRFVNRKSAKDAPFRRLRTALVNDLTKGGHLSSQPMGALFNYVDHDPETGKEHVVHFPVSDQNPYRTDESKLAALIHETKPELIVFGKSMFLYPEPVALAARAAAELDPRPLIHYDMAHVLGLYGAFQAPFEEGADVVTGSTHKTFFGPQRGVVAGNVGADTRWKGLWPEIKSRAFPGSTSNHHLGTLLGLFLATLEMNAFRREYQDQVRHNARAFAAALAAAGLRVEGDASDGYTRTHQVIVRVRDHGSGEEIARRLEEQNIVVNYQALPDDPSFIDSSGIRLGVQEMTRFGMKERDFETLAGFMADCIARNREVGDAVSRFRAGFLEMGYCLPAEEALPLAARVLASLLPGEERARRLADALADL
jgi:glycine/serine hydroxymethyltransferase